MSQPFKQSHEIVVPFDYDQYLEHMAQVFVDLVDDLRELGKKAYRISPLELADELNGLKPRVFQVVSFLIENETEIDSQERFDFDDELSWTGNIPVHDWDAEEREYAVTWRDLVEKHVDSAANDDPFSIAMGTRSKYFQIFINQNTSSIAYSILKSFGQKIGLITERPEAGNLRPNHPSAREISLDVYRAQFQLRDFYMDIDAYLNRFGDRLPLHCKYQSFARATKDPSSQGKYELDYEHLAGFGIAIKNAIANGAKLKNLEWRLFQDFGTALVPMLVALYDELPELVVYLDKSLSDRVSRFRSDRPFTDRVEGFYIRKYNDRIDGSVNGKAGSRKTEILEDIGIEYEVGTEPDRNTNPLVMGTPEGNFEHNALTLNVTMGVNGVVPPDTATVSLEPMMAKFLSSNQGFATELSLN